jgi:predicted metal-dependent HD superfamily phosphohydrolase
MKPPHKLIMELQARYAEPQRHYHTWDHIEALLTHFETIKHALHDPVSTLWALYWHDAIYDPHRPDNEDASADLLVGDAAGLLTDLSLKRADRIIRATKEHLVPSDISESDRHDLQIFLDIDLSILGARDDVFDTYEENIRKEYAFVPDDVYTQARSSILSGFLKRERLYFSDHFFKLWEHKARANLERSIARLAA